MVNYSQEEETTAADLLFSIEQWLREEFRRVAARGYWRSLRRRQWLYASWLSLTFLT